MISIIRRLLGMQAGCNHSFAMDDLRMVNPDGDKDRVEWPCSKCGKVFRAHCGLDIGRNGNIFRVGMQHD